MRPAPRRRRVSSGIPSRQTALRPGLPTHQALSTARGSEGRPPGPSPRRPCRRPQGPEHSALRVDGQLGLGEREARPCNPTGKIKLRKLHAERGRAEVFLRGLGFAGLLPRTASQLVPAGGGLIHVSAVLSHTAIFPPTQFTLRAVPTHGRPGAGGQARPYPAPPGTPGASV